MRILLVSEVFYPAGSISGASVALERLATFLSMQGHVVTILTTNRGNMPDEWARFRVVRVQGMPNPFRHGLRFTVFPRPLVRRIFAELQPDIVHLNDPASLASAAVRQARQLHIPVVVTNHFLPAYVLAYLAKAPLVQQVAERVLVRRLRRIYNQCQTIIVPTQTVAKHLQELTLTTPVRVISNGVDLPRFTALQDTAEFHHRFHVPKDKVLLGYVGRLDPEKNVPILLHALALLSGQQKTHLVIVGNGGQAVQLHRLADQLGVSGNVTWIPKLDATTTLMAQMYSAIDMFCMPCPIETESIATLEAMAAAKPVLVANGGALVELVEEGVNGLLVRPEDPQAWAEAIQKMIDERELWLEMGKQSHQRAVTRDLQVSLRLIENLYQEILQR